MLLGFRVDIWILEEDGNENEEDEG